MDDYDRTPEQRDAYAKYCEAARVAHNSGSQDDQDKKDEARDAWRMTHSNTHNQLTGDGHHDDATNN